MRVLVCGGRNFSDYGSIERTLDALHAATPIAVVITGAAPGADLMADAWARANKIAAELYPAKWDVQGRAAGPIRNQEMIEHAKPDLVVAFPGGKGTADMAARAERAGVKVLKVPMA